MKKTILLSLWLAGVGFIGCAEGMEKTTSHTDESSESAKYIVPAVSGIDMKNFDASDSEQVKKICSQISSRLILLRSWMTGRWNSTDHDSAELLGCVESINNNLFFWRKECKKELSKFTDNISDDNSWLIRDGKIDLECLNEDNVNREVELVSGEKTTLLDLAISTGAESVLRYLIFKSSYDVNTVDSSGYTLLDKLLGRKGSEFDDLAVGLIEQGGVFNADGISERNRRKVLFSAIMVGSCRKATSKLLSMVANVNGVLRGGETLLTIATMYNREDVVLSLLEKGADSREANSEGDQPIHIAADYNHMNIVKLLVSNGVSINDRGAGGDQTLHIAIRNRYKKMALELIEMGADISTEGKYNCTPIQCVAAGCHGVLFRTDYDDPFRKVLAQDYLEIYDALIKKGAVLDGSDFRKESVDQLIKLVNG